MAVQLVLNGFPGEPGVRQVQQEQVIVRAAGDHLVAHGDKFIAHGAAVADNGVDVFPELLRGGFLRCDGLSGDDVLQRAPPPRREARAPPPGGAPRHRRPGAPPGGRRRGGGWL